MKENVVIHGDCLEVMKDRFLDFYHDSYENLAGQRGGKDMSEKMTSRYTPRTEQEIIEFIKSEILIERDRCLGIVKSYPNKHKLPITSLEVSYTRGVSDTKFGIAEEIKGVSSL